MQGGTISGNTAKEYGGGVWLHPEAGSFTMQGGIIAGNTAVSGGDGVAVQGGVFKKEPLSSGGSSGIIYGSNGGTNSNAAKLAEVYLQDKGHAVYIADGPKTREVTAGPDQILDSSVPGGVGACQTCGFLHQN
jgi:hypothetical protein